MCPICIARTAAIVAGAGSTGGILTASIRKFTKIFRASSLGLFQETNENGSARQRKPEKALRNEDTIHRDGAGVEAVQQESLSLEKAS